MAEPRRRTGFAAVVLAGLGTAALTAVSSGKPWFRADVDYRLVTGVRDADRTADMPLAMALSLVVLAGWGAVLVTRGRVRRAMAAVALLAGLGVVACVVVAPFTLPDQVRENLLPGSDDVSVSPTGWFIAAAIGAVLAVVVLAVAWLRSPAWPTMSSRYDAPATRAAAPADTDLWKALDEGQDPTDPSRGSAPPSP
jgi:MFS family permease